MEGASVSVLAVKARRVSEMYKMLVVSFNTGNESESSHFYDPEFLRRGDCFGAFGFIYLSGDMRQLVSVEPRRSLGTFENMRMCFCFRKYTCIT